MPGAGKMVFKSYTEGTEAMHREHRGLLDRIFRMERMNRIRLVGEVPKPWHNQRTVRGIKPEKEGDYAEGEDCGFEISDFKEEAGDGREFRVGIGRRGRWWRWWRWVERLS
jgi:hypothetical protein